MQRYDYPAAAREVLFNAFDAIMAIPETAAKMQSFWDTYAAEFNCDIQAMRAEMKEVSKQANVHEYTGDLLFFICLARYMKAHYEKQGLDLTLMHDSLYDLKYKLDECHEVYGIWGTFVASWYDRFFKLSRFAFGRLQFETTRFNAEYCKNGLCLNPDSTVINVHIPRTGTKLSYESVKDAYRRAAAFFKEYFPDGPVVFNCHSWLFFPRNKEVLNEKSNLYAFMKDYDIFQSGEYEDYSQAWRLFDCLYEGDPERMPQDSSLRRAYVDWMRKGEKIGWGWGVYAFEEKDVVTRTFTYQEEPEQNPDIGFISFQHFRNDPLYSDIIVRPENNMRETENVEPYPVPAHVPQNGREEGYYPDTTMAYIRILWKEFEPVEGEYHYEVIEDVLQKAHEQGQTVMFRLLPHSTRAEDDVPEWLRDIVDCPVRPEGARLKDSPKDPKYLQLFGRAWEKIAERFDNDPRLDIVDICLPGAWGEGHKLNEYSEEVLKEHVDVYTRAFKNTHLMGQVLAPELVAYANETQPVGWRGDGIGQPNLMATKFPRAAGMLPDLWIKSPITFESYWWLGEWYRQGWDIEDVMEACLDWHLSTFNAKSIPCPFIWEDKVKEWVRRMGYHFVVDSFTCPVSAKAGESATVAWSINNVGVAPIYRPTTFRIRLTNENGTYEFDTAADARKWLPGRHCGEMALNLPADIKAGEYSVQVALISNDVPPIYLPTSAPRHGNYYEVGAITVE